jgi:hypothetical protein
MLQIFHEGLKRSARLLEASTSRLPSPPLSPHPPFIVRFSFLSVPMLVELSSEEFDIIFQRSREEIGEYDGVYIDSQEKELYAIHSSCEKLNEDDFQEGEYTTDELRSLKDLWWPEEYMYNMDTYMESN